ncbi:MAG: hypothetical protein ABL921_04420 [Pirellula sp.]
MGKFKSVRWANVGLGSVHCSSDRKLLRWRYGEVETHAGHLVAISGRWWPWLASQWDTWRDAYLKDLPTDVCRFYYAFPIRSPDFMAVLYTHSGPMTQYKTFCKGVTVLDEIAMMRKVQAVVCQATNERLNERLMRRLGYVRHAFSLGENHYIKRLKGSKSLSNESPLKGQTERY